MSIENLKNKELNLNQIDAVSGGVCEESVKFVSGDKSKYSTYIHLVDFYNLSVASSQNSFLFVNKADSNLWFFGKLGGSVNYDFVEETYTILVDDAGGFYKNCIILTNGMYEVKADAFQIYSNQ